MEYNTKIVRKLVTILVGEERGIVFDRWLDEERAKACNEGYEWGLVDGQEGGCLDCYNEGYRAGSE